MGKHFPFVLGCIMGAVVGWVVGTLYAPSAGPDTRQQISQRAIELGGRAAEIGGRAEQTAAEMAGQVRRRLGATHELDLQG